MKRLPMTRLVVHGVHLWKYSVWDYDIMRGELFRRTFYAFLDRVRSVQRRPR